MFSFDIDTSGATFDHFAVTSTGFTYYNYSAIQESTLLHFGCFKFSSGLAFANGGGIANPSTSPATQVGILSGAIGGGTFSNFDAFVPDAGIGQAFYLSGTSFGSLPTGLTGFQPH